MDTVRIVETFVELADSLVDSFDVFDQMHLLVTRCVELLDVGAAGALLVDGEGRLRVAAETSPDARLLDLFQMQDEMGPSLDCYNTATAVAVDIGEEARARWPRFASEAADHGFTSVVALPLRLRGEAIGVLNLLIAAENAPLSGPQTRIAQGLADAVTIAILQHRLSEDRRVLNQQLQHALNSRVVVEQGKGVLSTRLRVSTEEAFEMMRRRARATSRRISDVADEIRRHGPNTDWEDYRNDRPGGRDPRDHRRFRTRRDGCAHP
jgi:GAF domain-containing protein